MTPQETWKLCLNFCEKELSKQQYTTWIMVGLEKARLRPLDRHYRCLIASLWQRWLLAIAQAAI